MSDDSDLLQVSVISFDSAVEVTELSEFESLAISPTEQEIYAAPTATFSVAIIHINSSSSSFRFDLKHPMRRNF